MKKRTSLKVLLSASIIFAMIPFFLTTTHALGGSPNLRLLYSFDDSNTNEVYLNADFIFTDSNPSAYGFYEVTFINDTVKFSYALTDGSGFESIEYESYTDGGYNYRKYTITYENTGYLVMRFTFRASSSFWTQSALNNPTQKIGLTFTNYTSGYRFNGTDNTYSYLYYIKQYLYQLSTDGLTIDLTSLTELLSEIITNQETMIELLTALQNGNSSSTESSTTSEETTTELQTVTDDYKDIESDLSTDFSNNMNDIDTTTWTTRLTGWSTGINWLKTQMNNMFTSMGEYKYMLEIGMILAIALIFIGR